MSIDDVMQEPIDEMLPSWEPRWSGVIIWGAGSEMKVEGERRCCCDISGRDFSVENMFQLDGGDSLGCRSATGSQRRMSFDLRDWVGLVIGCWLGYMQCTTTLVLYCYKAVEGYNVE